MVGVEEESWDCTVCTYKNSAEAFRCEMCQTRKGTSTRKPKLNRQIVEEQSLIARAIIKERQEESGSGIVSSDGVGSQRRRHSRHAAANSAAGNSSSVVGNTAKNGELLRPGYDTSLELTDEKPKLLNEKRSLVNVDRSSPLLFEIFANGFSVVITEYHPKVSSPSTTGGGCKQSSSLADSPAPSNSSSILGFTSTPLGVSVSGASHPDLPRSNQFPSPTCAGGNYSAVEASVSLTHTAPASKEGGAENVDEDLEPVGEAAVLSAATTISTSPSTATSLNVITSLADNSVPSTPPLTRKRRRRRRVRGDFRASIPSRSLRSSGASAAASRSRQASRIARASLYRAGGSSRTYKRRKLTSGAAVVAATATQPSTPNAENTASMTDSCGAVTLEMPATSATS
uniref:RanBP2-type domain-containing protein n=1 Tax=Mesocestoides corti TaxID=53468 RepID=A0A5K3FI17_MESCO